MRIRIWIAVLLVVVTGIAAVASASMYGGVEEREEMRIANMGWQQGMGDQGGVFAAALNATQPIYYVYDWNMDFFSLAVAQRPHYDNWGTDAHWVGETEEIVVP